MKPSTAKAKKKNLKIWLWSIAAGLFLCVFISFVYTAKNIGAGVAAFIVLFTMLCGFISGCINLEVTSERADKKDNIRTATSFCDELMNDLCKYWMNECSDKNKIEMGVLRERISSYNKLITRVIEDYFSGDDDIKQAFDEVKKIIDEVNAELPAGPPAGPPADPPIREPNIKKAQDAIDAIIGLRNSF